MMKLTALGCLLAFAMWPVLAKEASKRPPPEPSQFETLNSQGFLAAHPDLRWRREGMQSLEENRGTKAMARFKRAARHADKPSQAMIAEMLWTGRGVPVDRPRAYAWMDIAAERAYVPFLAKRERYWAAMDADERTRAVDVGRQLYEEYGDESAKPRLELVLQRARRDITGSRVGFVGSLKVVVFGPDGTAITIDGDHFYEEKFWVPKQYFAWQDSIWKDPPTGHVDVLPMEVVRDRQATPAGGD